MAPTITEEDLQNFLKLCHQTYTNVPPKKDPLESLGHIYSILIPEESVLDPVSMLQLSRRCRLMAAIDRDGSGVSIPIEGTNYSLFAFAPKDAEDNIDRQLEEMTLPRGSLALALSLEAFIILAKPDGNRTEPMKVRQTFVAAPGGRICSLVSTPDSVIEAKSFFGETMERFQAVVERIPTY